MPHELPWHTYGSHCGCCTAGQEAPLPGQLAGLVAVPPEQEPARHEMPLGLNASAGQSVPVVLDGVAVGTVAVNEILA